MSASFSPRLAHMGVCCTDIDKMIDFYTHVFNFKVTDKGPGNTFPFMLAFLSANPEQHHQLALAQNRPDRGATRMRGLNHGNAISIYCLDPEENTVEVYLDTPWYVSQPHGDPLDLDKPDAEIWRETEAIVRADPTFKPVAQWSKDVFG
jgi:catechol 2,3-dioxygenase